LSLKPLPFLFTPKPNLI